MNPLSQPEPPRRTQGGPVGNRRRRRWAVLLSAAGAATAVTLAWGGSVAADTVQARTGAEPSSAPAALSVPATVPDEPVQALAGEPTPVDVPAHPGGHEAPPGAQAPGGVPAAPPSQGNPAGQGAADAGKVPASGKPGEKLAAQNPSEQGTVPGARKEKSLAEAGSEAVPGQAGGKGSGAGNGADRSAGLAPRGAIDPKEVLGAGETALGGCLAEYGADGQCLPVVPPSSAEHVQQMTESGADPKSMLHFWSCDEVRGFFPDGIAVRQAATDPQGLDANADGTACGADD
ncbi:hypothetical protein [Arthrobacter sp. NPDC092385]|uniref:hypothetical protein n=1 Tax=Arthrobacter sp. NPDC092385 TaxID=3363943 RepID=UPI00380CCE1A